jgi:tetratricopeptide (TPR) repeat protein
LELQPGIRKNVLGVFEMPLKQLKNDPEFYISRETNWGSVSLFPKSIAPAPSKTAWSENKNQVEKIEEKPLNENASGGAKADNPTEVLNQAKALDDQVSDSSKLVDQLLQSPRSDENSFNKTLSELKALPKPNVGNTIEATRLNKLGIEELKDQNYEHAAFQFDAAVKADPSEAKYLSNLGYAETYDGDLDSAWKHLCLSIQLDPSRSVAWGDLGILLAKQGSQEKSVSAFLIGDKVVEGGTRDFLEHLVSNKANDATVREASASALERLKKTNSTGLAGH